MKQKEILEYNKNVLNFLGIKIDFNVADWSEYNDKSLTEHWNNNDKIWISDPKGQGLPWYKVKHRDNFYQLFTDFTFQKLKQSDIKLGGEYNGKYYELEDMQFHSDFNWIMEVVEAIEKLPEHYTTAIHSDVIDKGDEHKMFIFNNEGEIIVGENGKTKKEAIVQTINQFLKFYNNENS